MRERRFTIYDGKTPSIRAEKQGDKMFFVGYAAIFNVRSKLIFANGDFFVEIIKPGAFKNALLQNPDVVLTLDHDHFFNLGRTSSGNLELSEDATGLLFRALVPNTTLGRDTFEMVSRGDYTDCSFAFSVNPAGEEWIREDNGGLLHIVNEVSALYDVTICTLHGAYGETIINVEMAQRMFKELIQDKTDKKERDGDDPPDPDKTDPDKTDPDDPSNKKPADPDPDQEEILVENDLDQMILDVHKAKL